MRKRQALMLLLALSMMVGILAGCDPNRIPLETQGTPATLGTDAEGNVIIPEKYQNLAYFDTDHPERYGGVVAAAAGNFASHLDINAPGAAAGTTYWARYVYESALVTGIDGKIYPLVCEYRYDEENKEWLELWVREGVTFHDGTLVTIEDVWASYNRNPKYQYIHEGIVDATITDGVLRITYDIANGYNCVKPLYWFGYYSADFGIMPKWICEQFPATGSGDIILDPQYVIGTGCYKIVEEDYVAMEQIVLERHESYIPCFDGDVLGEGQANGRAAPRIAYLDKIILYGGLDHNASIMMLLAEDIQVCYATIDEYNMQLSALGYEMYRDEGGKIADTPALLFNLHTEETSTDGKASTATIADDVYLRMAICAAINVDEVMYSNYTDWWEPESSPVDVIGYSKDAFENAPYRSEKGNIELAKEYLAKSNYSGEMIILRRPSSYGHAMAQTIKKNCAEAGINIDIEPYDPAAYQSDYRCGASGWDFYLLCGSNTSTWTGFMPVNSYIPYGNKEAAAWRHKMFSEMNGTEASLEAWENLSQIMADECSYFVLGRSLGDRFVGPSDLNFNCCYFWSLMYAYWDNPSAHGG